MNAKYNTADIADAHHVRILSQSSKFYVGESVDDLSVYVMDRWSAFCAMWTLVGEWAR